MRGMGEPERRAELQIAAYYLKNGPHLIGVGVDGSDEREKANSAQETADEVPSRSTEPQSGSPAKTWDSYAFLVGMLQGLLVCLVQNNPTLVAILIGIVLFICCRIRN